MKKQKKNKNKKKRVVISGAENWDERNFTKASRVSNLSVRASSRTLVTRKRKPQCKKRKEVSYESFIFLQKTSLKFLETVNEDCFPLWRALQARNSPSSEKCRQEKSLNLFSRLVIAFFISTGSLLSIFCPAWPRWNSIGQRNLFSRCDWRTRVSNPMIQ